MDARRLAAVEVLSSAARMPCPLRSIREIVSWRRAVFICRPDCSIPYKLEAKSDTLCGVPVLRFLLLGSILSLLPACGDQFDIADDPLTIKTIVFGTELDNRGVIADA